MALLQIVKNMFQDPTPDFVFELTEAGVACARPSSSPIPEFYPLEPGTVVVSPLSDNVHRPEVLSEQIRTIAGPGSGLRRRSAVLILPDFCSRVAMLEFDSFPTDSKEQNSLVRFRMKKSVPFDVESAVIGYHTSARKGGKGVNAVVVAASLEIVGRYEAPFRAAGLQPGYVTTSAIAAFELIQEPGISVFARLTGRLLTVSVVSEAALRLVRCVELASASHDEIVGVLFPTIAYVEDDMGERPARLLLSGFGDPEGQSWQEELEVPVETLQSRFGPPSAYNAGLLGYLESLGGAGRKAA